MTNLGRDVRNIVFEILQEKHVAAPASIVEYDPDDLRAKVRLKHRDKEGNPPVIEGVPVATVRAGGLVIIPPYTEGDQIICVFSDRDIESGLFDSNEREPVRAQANQLDYCVVIGGVSHEAEDLSSVQGADDSMRIATEDGTSVIELTSAGEIKVVSDTVELGSGTAQKLVNASFQTIYNGHTHPDPVSGTTGPPNQQMTPTELTQNTEAS